MIVALPVVRGRSPKYVLTATLSPRRLREVLRAQPVPEGWRFALNDARQIVIASTEDPDPFMGQPITARMAQEFRRLGLPGAIRTSPWGGRTVANQPGLPVVFPR